MKNYIDRQGNTYQPESECFGYTCIKVLQFLYGKKWDDVSLAFVHSLRPSYIRVIENSETSDSKTWRVTVRLNDDKTIREIEQEVEVWLPDGSDMIRETFSEMVRLWNERHGKYVISLDMTRISPTARTKIMDVIDHEICRLRTNINCDIADNGKACGVADAGKGSQEMHEWSKGLYDLWISIRDQEYGLKKF